MTYWPWWAGGLALSGVMLFHWLATRRMMAVSGRYTALVDRVRIAPVSDAAGPARAPAQTVPDHIVFLVSLAIGGFVATRLHGHHDLTPLLAGAGFARLARHSPAAGVALLVLGGALVGFGTRMAGGCTSGHGMCGVSRLQKGSLLATVAFFGTGVVTAFTLGWLS